MSAIVDVYPDDDLPEPDAGCKFTVADKAPFDTSSTYWREYVRTCKIVASHPEGAYLNQIVAELHGRDEVSSGDTEYQRTRRFLNSHPNFFEVRKVNGLVTAYPTLELFDLIKRGIIQRGPENACTGGSQYEGNKDFAARMLQGIQWDRQDGDLINQKGKDLLEKNLSEYLERINDLRLVLRSDYADPEYLTLPYKTRFNDAGRISKQHAILGKSLEKAAEMYDHAVLLTLTTDPKKFSSVWEMWAGDPDDDRDTGINGNWNRLMSWLSAESRLGDRPDYIKVLEATEKGMPHLHAIVFLDEDQTRSDGMPWLESKSEVSRYWNKYQGRTVDLQPLTWVDDLGDEYDKDEGWVRWSDDGDHGGDLGGEGGAASGGGQTAGEYLGKYLSAIYGGMRSAAGIGGDGGQQVATDGGEPIDASDELDGGKYEDKAATWKIAMYWATRRKIRTESRDLRQAVEEDMEDEDDEDKADVAEQIRQHRYEFVGAYRYGEIPDHIRTGAVPVDSLMKSLEEEGIRDVDPRKAGDRPPEKRRVDLLSRTPSSAWGLLPEDLVGSGMLEDDRDDDRDADQEASGRDRDGDDDQPQPKPTDPTEYPVDVMSEDEREEAEEHGGFDAAGFM